MTFLYPTASDGLLTETRATALPPTDLQALLETLFETYPLYEDRESRRAVEEVLKALVGSEHGDAILNITVRFLKQECAKKGIAHANALALVEWCSVLLQHFAKAPERWTKYGLDVAVANARVLETCVGAGNARRAGRITDSALVSTRRALRALFRADTIGKDVLAALVTSLTTKGPASTAGNAVFLGVIAGVSSRLQAVKPEFEKHKPAYYAYYVREIVGSRSQLPDHISNALSDFFESFPPLDELHKEVIPPIEKAMLRAPEVVLNDIVSPMILALPESMDLSEILLANMLKPLLSNVKSSNPSIRTGTLRTFKAFASRSKNDDAINKVADEILNPLKQGKVSGADQKVVHAQMLSALPRSASLSRKIPTAMASVALKEPSEPAVVAEVATLTEHLMFGLATGVALDKAVSDAFVKGMADKRVPVRRLWATHAADLWWSLSETQLAQPDILAFCQTTLPKLVEIWQEVTANPIPATQTGLVTVGHYVSALLLTKVRNIKDEKLAVIYKKSDVLSQTLAVQPKPSFLFNSKVYSKLSTEEDVSVAVRALTAVAPFLTQETSPKDAEVAWANAFIFFIVAQGVSSKAKSLAKQALTQTYLHVSPLETSRIILRGIWSWYRSYAREEKDSPAIASKTGAADLATVLGCICLSREAVQNLAGSVDKSALQAQALDLLVPARSEMIPRASWIDLCLRMGIDPGQLVRSQLESCMSTIKSATEVCRNQQYTVIF